VALEGSWGLVDGLVSIHKEEVGSWTRSFASLEVEGLKSNVIVDMSVGKAAYRVENSLADSGIDSLTWRSFYLKL